MGRVNQKVVLVTGAARGMGAAHARLLVSEGAQVVVTDILDEEGEALASELGNAAIYVHQDVSEPKSWATVIAAAEATFGSLHGLVNNAGIASMAPIEQFPLDQWNRTLAVNLTGVFLGIQAALPAIRRAGEVLLSMSHRSRAARQPGLSCLCRLQVRCARSPNLPRSRAPPPESVSIQFILVWSPRT